MKTAYHLRLFDLLEQAQGWPPSDRRRLAEAACAGGPVSAQELLAALDRVEQLSGFLESPAWSTETAPDPESATRSWIGREIGPYRILAMLGSGGMGQVFLAEQQEPRRQVALKLIRSESISDSAAERFRAEQRALARLNHPHVAQFIEAGVSQEGRPFFAMELVEGQPIDAYLEDEIPAFEERLALFLQVCAAVHHAHQKQIVHRDLKPSNVLVRPVDGRAVVKVIDFGIAEALDRPIAGAGVDDSGGVYGTPEFLSPESFDGDVDTRADIYALGALLYQLVCGISPFRRGQGTPADLVERIRRGEKEAASVAAARVNLPWAARIRGDLEAIIVRAMHPQRDRRYGSVVDLVADVRLFLGSRPVSVLEPSVWHRGRLFFRRRRGATIAATVAVLSVLAGASAATFGLLRARHEAEVARQALTESEAMSEFLTGLFQQSDPNRAMGEEITARELLDQGVERIDEDLREHPRIRAQMTRTLGDIYSKLGHHGQAEELLLESLRLFEEHIGGEPLQQARALSGLGVMKSNAGDREAARDYFERASAVLEEHPELDPTLRGLTVYHLGALLFRDQLYGDAAPYFVRACDIWERNDGAPEYRARCLDALGATRQELGEPRAAHGYLAEALRIRESIDDPDPLHIANSLESLCVLEMDLMRLNDAQDHCGRAFEIRNQALGEAHGHTVRGLALIAVAHRLAGDYAEAESLLQRALAFDTENGRAIAASRGWTRLGWVSWLQGRYKEAEDRYRRAVEVLPETDTGQAMAAQPRLGIGLSLWKQGQLDSAEAELEELLDYRRRRDGEHDKLTTWPKWGLAGVAMDRATAADLERAKTLLLEVLRVRRSLYPAHHEYLALVEEDYRELLRRKAELGSSRGRGAP